MDERRKSKPSIARWILLGIMVIAMGGFGLSGVIGGFTSDTAVAVGKTEVSLGELNNAYQNAVDEASRRPGRPLSKDEARLAGVDQAVIEGVTQRAALREAARVQGIAISDKAVAEQIASYSAFHGPDGKINRDQYELFLRANRISESDFVESIRNDLTFELYANEVASLVPPQDALIASVDAQLGEMRSANFLTITDADVRDDLAPIDDAQIAAYYDANSERFLGEAERQIDIAYLRPDLDGVSDDAIAQYYEDNQERFQVGARVTDTVMLNFPTIEAASAINTKDDLIAEAQTRGLTEDSYSFPMLPLSELDGAIVSAIEANGEGFYPPIESAFGYTVLFVGGYAPEGSIPLEEVQDDIRKGLAFDELQATLGDAQSQILDLIAGGVAPKELAATSPLMFLSANSLEAPIDGLTNDENFTTALNSVELDENSELITLSDGGVAVLRIMSEKAPEIQPLEAVKEDARALIEAEQLYDAQTALYETIKTARDAGESLEAIGAQNGLDYQSTDSVQRSSALDSMPFSVALQLFDMSEGELREIREADIVYVTELAEVAPFSLESEAGQTLHAENAEAIDSLLGNFILRNYANAYAIEQEAVIYRERVEPIFGKAEE